VNVFRVNGTKSCTRLTTILDEARARASNTAKKVRRYLVRILAIFDYLSAVHHAIFESRMRSLYLFFLQNIDNCYNSFGPLSSN